MIKYSIALLPHEAEQVLKALWDRVASIEVCDELPIDKVNELVEVANLMANVSLQALAQLHQEVSQKGGGIK